MTLLSGINALRTSGALVLAGAVLSGPVAVFGVARTAPQPAWSDVTTFVAHYHPVQVLPYVLGYVLLAGFVLFSAACHDLAGPSMRARASAALVFTGIYAALVFTNYTVQLGFVPRILDERPDYLSVLTMANPASFAWFLEMFGYAAMGVATCLVAPIFGGSRRGRTVRCLLVANGVFSVIGAACVAIVDRWVFSSAGLVSFAGWNLLIVVCFLLITMAPDGAIAPVQGLPVPGAQRPGGERLKV